MPLNNNQIQKVKDRLDDIKNQVNNFTDSTPNSEWDKVINRLRKLADRIENNY